MNSISVSLRQSWRDWCTWDIAPRSPAWMQWIWTVLFAAAIAFGFTVIGMAAYASRDPMRWLDVFAWARWFRANFVVSLTISVTIHLLFDFVIPLVGGRRIRQFSPGKRAAFFIALPMTGVFIGWPLGVWLVGQNVANWVRIDHPGQIIGSAIIALGISFVFFMFFNARAQQATAEKRATEAQLRLLQGQIEPHFLFNTLANVQTLIEHEPVKARQMLESFTDYLRSSLGGLRREQSSLGDELDLARAYLGLIQSRMESRLRFRIDCSADARQAMLPPLLIQPLIENAIHHGLEPKVEGGEVVVSARIDGDKLLLTVADDGLGLEALPRRAARPGNGVALDNVRQRLDAAYGTDASLVLSNNNPGTLATLRLPLTRTEEP